MWGFIYFFTVYKLTNTPFRKKKKIINVLNYSVLITRIKIYCVLFNAYKFPILKLSIII